MKNLKRALRRHQWEVKFKKRIKNWLKDCTKNKQSLVEEILKGEICTFLRTTGNPCNCYCCSGYNKYVRIQKQYTKKAVENFLLEED